jgi:hypothetical protein
MINNRYLIVYAGCVYELDINYLWFVTGRSGTVTLPEQLSSPRVLVRFNLFCSEFVDIYHDCVLYSYCLVNESVHFPLT